MTLRTQIAIQIVFSSFTCVTQTALKIADRPDIDVALLMDLTFGELHLTDS